jgi:uroporphyrinogen decarboxylase
VPQLKPRERLLTALNHGVPDRIPLDLGGSYATGINVAAYRAWKDHLGLDTPTVVASRRSQIACVEESLRVRFGIDTWPILPRAPFSPPEQVFADGSYRDEWGVVRSRPEGGHYYVSHEPLAAECTVSSLESYPWPRASDPGYVQGLRAEALRGAATDYAVVLGLPVGMLHQAAFLRGTANLLMDLLSERALAEALLECILGILLDITGRMLDEVGDLVDVVMFADDLGSNDRPLMSPALYRSLVKPRQRRYLDHVHSKTRAKVVYHTCGAIYPLIGDFVDIGVDVLNPVQVSAAGMDPARLKREFGHDICFWGGLDVVELLPRATPEEVRASVERMVETLGPEGYVVSATNNIQPDVSPANISAMLEAARDYPARPLIDHCS